MTEYAKIICSGLRLCEEFGRSKDDILIEQYEDCHVINVKVAKNFIVDFSDRIFETSDKWFLHCDTIEPGEDIFGNPTSYYLFQAALRFIDFPPNGLEEAA